jgi:hypothetical protein
MTRNTGKNNNPFKRALFSLPGKISRQAAKKRQYFKIFFLASLREFFSQRLSASGAPGKAWNIS